MRTILDLAVLGMEALGAAVIVASVIIAGWRFAQDLSDSTKKQNPYRRLRANLGRGILLGLELLVAADIINTITAPLTFESVAALGLIVLIRTFLSFSLETEIEGRWPWQRHRRSRSSRAS